MDELEGAELPAVPRPSRRGGGAIGDATAEHDEGGGAAGAAVAKLEEGEELTAALRPSWRRGGVGGGEKGVEVPALRSIGQLASEEERIRREENL